MHKIGPKNSTQEKMIKKIISSLKYKYRTHEKKLPGTPDIVFPWHKKVIFINGCFWHGHKNCKRAILPITNREFWVNKIEGNIQRDKANLRSLKKIGWGCLVLWQCKITKRKENILKSKILSFIQA